MVPAIRWLVRLGVDQGLFSLDQARSVLAGMSDEVELLSFAQQMVDEGHVDDDRLAELEKAAGLAFAKGKAGPPADDLLGTPAPAATRAPTPAPAAPAAAPAPAAPTASPDPSPPSGATVNPPPPARRTKGISYQ